MCKKILWEGIYHKETHSNAYIFKLVHNKCQFSTFEGLPTTFEGSSNVSYNTSLLTIVPIGANAWTYKLSMHTKYVIFI